jgi:hypothetical protein
VAEQFSATDDVAFGRVNRLGHPSIGAITCKRQSQPTFHLSPTLFPDKLPICSHHPTCDSKRHHLSRLSATEIKLQRHHFRHSTSKPQKDNTFTTSRSRNRHRRDDLRHHPGPHHHLPYVPNLPKSQATTSGAFRTPS